MAEPQKIDASLGIDAILEHGFSLLEKHQWVRAKRYFEKATEIAPENAYSYLGCLLVTLKLPNIDSLQSVSRNLMGSSNFQKAMRFADAELREKLDSYHILAMNNLKDIEYQKATSILKNARNKYHYQEIIDLLTPISDWKDSQTIIDTCKKKIEGEAKNNKIFWAIFISAFVLCSVATLLYSITVFLTFLITSFFLIAIPTLVVFLLPKNVFPDNKERLSFIKKFKKYIVIAAVCIFAFANILPFISSTSEADDGKCGVCDGSGYVADDGWGLETCPYCHGTGVPPI